MSHHYFLNNYIMRTHTQLGEAMDVSWGRLASIFDDISKPLIIWEQQFDYCNEVLYSLCTSPWQKINFHELGYYYNDLAYVKLQPEVFRYLFPVCLMAWHTSLLDNTSCSAGDAEFHYGLYKGNVLNSMTTSRERDEIYAFLHDSFLTRLDRERGLCKAIGKPKAYGWISRFNSIGLVFPIIEKIWNTWWSQETPGRAVAVLEFLAALLYPYGGNPIIMYWNQSNDEKRSPLFFHDTFITNAGWLPENASFLAKVLSYDLIEYTLNRTLSILSGEPEHQFALFMLKDITENKSILQLNIDGLLHSLPRTDAFY